MGSLVMFVKSATMSICVGPWLLIEEKSILIDEFKTHTWQELGKLSSGNADVNVHSSSAEGLAGSADD
jgi:hypothetical protein